MWRVGGISKFGIMEVLKGVINTTHGIAVWTKVITLHTYGQQDLWEYIKINGVN